MNQSSNNQLVLRYFVNSPISFIVLMVIALLHLKTYFHNTYKYKRKNYTTCHQWHLNKPYTSNKQMLNKPNKQYQNPGSDLIKNLGV